MERKEGESTSLEFEADSIILLYFIREKKKRQRFIEVLKMRGTEHSTEIHPLETSKSGFKVSRKVYSDGIR
jgi:KaiC/GvpD/RAD55 family RecA-like ATPase